MSISNKYVVVKSNKGAGLGDNLCVVFAGILVSVLYGRKLIVDWSDGSFGDLGVNTFPLFFELSSLISDDISLADLNSSLDVQPPVWTGNLLRNSYELYLEQNWDTYERKRTISLLSSDPSYYNSEVDILVLTDFTRLPCDLSLINSGSVVSRYISPSAMIQEYLEEYINLNLVEPYIGVHVRMTDEQGAREKFRKHSYYIQLLRNILDGNHTLSKIFLATDNLSAINCWKNDFPDVIFRPKSMPPKSGDPIHLTEFSVPRFELTIDAVLDMLILEVILFFFLIIQPLVFLVQY